MAVKEKSLDVRYFTYYLHFPKDKDFWVDQVPFIHDLQFELKNWRYRNDMQKCNDMIRKGETRWEDQNGVTHRIVIEDTPRPKRWGVNRQSAIRR